MTRPPLLFRVLLGILPRRFREEHAEEIVELAARYASDRSGPARTIVWLRAAADVVSVALGSRWGRPSRDAGVGARATAGGEGVGRRAPSATLAGVAQDLRYGLRSLRRDLGLSVFAVLIVGLGVGASVTVFSVVQALLLRPLPFHEPERLTWISNGEWGRGQQLSAISVQVRYLVAMRSGATQLTDVAGYHLFDGIGDHTLAGDGEPERVTRLRVTANLFDVLGLQPLLGRGFTEEEAWDGGPPAILLTHAFWQRRFGSDRSVVGRAMTIDGTPTTIVGVLPPTFDFTSIFAPGRRVDYVAPFPLSPSSDRTGNTLGLIGRLAPGATLESARAEAAALADLPYPGEREGNRFRPVVRPLREHVSGSYRAAMVVLVGAVTLVMLIVCANLSNLLLARGAAREQEMAIRAAMGAGRRRLVQQMLTESALLSAAGAALGLVLAQSATRFLAGRDLPIPLLAQARVDGQALGVALAAAVAVGILFGVAPALRGARVTLHESLKEGVRGGSASRRKGSLRSALVVSEIALASLLLVVSTLMTRSLLQVLDVDLGFRADRVVALRIDPSRRFSSDEARVAFYGEVLDRMGSAPGVVAAGLSDILPMGFNRTWSARSTDRPEEDAVYPYVRVASDGYVDALGLGLVAGRDLAPSDDAGSPRVALVNEALAEALWPGADPLGRSLRASGRDYEVVGVVRGTRQRSAEQEAGLEVFFSVRQLGDHAAVHLVLRGARSLPDLVATARAELHAIDPTLPLDAVVVLRDVVDASVAPRRFMVVLLTGFAAFALLLATLGIYGVISYSVTQRSPEIGIHIALGASSAEVRARIVRETLVLAALGLAVGMVAALGAGRLLEGLLFGVTPLDPITYGAVATLLAAVAAVAGYLPARRATAASPLRALSGGAAR